MSAKVFSSEGTLYPFDAEAGVYAIDTDPRKTFHLQVESWDESDFFALSTGEWGYRFVSERVVEAARRNRWTNFAFLPLKEGCIVEFNSYREPLKYL